MKPFIFRYPIPEEQLDGIGNWHSFYYFHAFFEARKALFSELGITPDSLENLGLTVIIRTFLESEFLRPIRKGEVALVRIKLVKLGKTSMVFHYEVYKEGEDHLCATGGTVQLLFNYHAKKTAPFPDRIKEILQKLAE